ncbi:hypothetical protein E2C01_045962 [Portunus trituberculatus]|uniref:Uncharacterized protein n=1 Tax=Portunus trituberculatus TaxID=210409 RepID=A0A5B7FZN3_PORTR|nr:hypothetical protein [Portunus trituberculatus]
MKAVEKTVLIHHRMLYKGPGRQQDQRHKAATTTLQHHNTTLSLTTHHTSLSLSPSLSLFLLLLAARHCLVFSNTSVLHLHYFKKVYLS